MHGPRTVVKTYESLALDKHVNVHGMAYGIGMDAEIWRQRLLEYQADNVVVPDVLHFESGSVLPWPARLKAMSSPDVATAMAVCDQASVALLDLLVADVEVRCDFCSFLFSDY